METHVQPVKRTPFANSKRRSNQLNCSANNRSFEIFSVDNPQAATAVPKLSRDTDPNTTHKPNTMLNWQKLKLKHNYKLNTLS